MMASTSTPASGLQPYVNGAGRSPSGAGTILLVDGVDINRQWLKGILKAGHYRILEARQPSEALKLLDGEEVDLIIADMVMNEMGGLEFCRQVKANRRTRLIPLLLMTSVHGIENEVAGLESGADEFLLRPLQPVAVRTRVRAMLRNKRVTDSLDEAESILFALAQAVEQRDKETGNHCERLAAMSVAMGMALGLPEEDLLALRRGGFLHDIGKIGVPDAILFKRGPLDEREWEVMRRHTQRGEEICRPMNSLAPVLPIIRSHHERWDGSGYPDGLAGERIPLRARILQLADIYDALTSERSYKPAYGPEEALQVLREETDRGWRDPELVPVFCEIVQPGCFAARGAQGLPAPAEDPAAAADLARMRESLARMNAELLK